MNRNRPYKVGDLVRFLRDPHKIWVVFRGNDPKENNSLFGATTSSDTRYGTIEIEHRHIDSVTNEEHVEHRMLCAYDDEIEWIGKTINYNEYRHELHKRVMMFRNNKYNENAARQAQEERYYQQMRNRQSIAQLGATYLNISIGTNSVASPPEIENIDIPLEEESYLTIKKRNIKRLDL